MNDKRRYKGIRSSIVVMSPLAYIGNASRTKLKKYEMSLRGVFD